MSYRDTPERETSKRDNPALLPPPRKPKSKHDSATAPIKGIGTGGIGAGMGPPGSYPKYRTAKALEDAVNLYFETKTEAGKPFTMAGLALSLGFSSARTLRTYEERGEAYADIIEVARTRVEEWKNELLLEGGRATNGVIFDLKNNHGWSDRIEQKTTVEAGGTLADLLASLQGTVLRPTLNHQHDEDIEDGVFEEVCESDLDDIINSNPQAFDNYLDDLEDLI